MLKPLIPVKTIMKKFAFTICLLIVYLFTCSAQDLVGKVMDENGQAIEFANVGILGTNKGSVTDEKGLFSLDISSLAKTDTLRVSAIGFKTSDIILGSIQNTESTFDIKLEESIYELPKIDLNASAFTKKMIKGNEIRKSSVSLGFSENILGAEAGVKIKNKKKSTWIKKLGFAIARNKLDTLLFRVNVYELKRNKVGQKILREDIIIETSIEEGVVEVDLSAYEIVTDKDIIVALEWIKDFGVDITTELNFYGGLMKKPLFYKNTSHAPWKKIRAIGLGIWVEVAQ